jgi:flagellar biosynthesis chaperone FliJ
MSNKIAQAERLLEQYQNEIAICAKGINQLEKERVEARQNLDPQYDVVIYNLRIAQARLNALNEIIVQLERIFG